MTSRQMKRTLWDDLFDLGIGAAATVGLIAIFNALSNTNQHSQLQDLRTETQTGFVLLRQENAELRNRVAILERESARLRPFADFLESKQKEAEQEKRILLPKPKLHLWR